MTVEQGLLASVLLLHLLAKGGQFSDVLGVLVISVETVKEDAETLAELVILGSVERDGLGFFRWGLNLWHWLVCDDTTHLSQNTVTVAVVTVAQSQSSDLNTESRGPGWKDSVSVAGTDEERRLNGCVGGLISTEDIDTTACVELN